jgi:hypothetical protein
LVLSAEMYWYPSERRSSATARAFGLARPDLPSRWIAASSDAPVSVPSEDALSLAAAVLGSPLVEAAVM